MNSFLTQEDTEKIIRKYSGFQVTIKTFLQSRYPRINRDTLMPLARSVSPLRPFNRALLVDLRIQKRSLTSGIHQDTEISTKPSPAVACWTAS